MTKTVKEMEEEQRFLKKVIDGMEDGKTKKDLMSKRHKLQNAVWEALPREDRLYAYRQLRDVRVSLGLE